VTKAGLKDVARRWVMPFLNPKQVASLAYLPRFLAELRRYRRMTGADSVRLGETYPCLTDRIQETPFDPHYFFQGAWLARRLAQYKPAQHVDIGSSVMMLSVLSAHVPTVFVDYRPLRTNLPGIQSVGGDLLRLPFADATLMSVSSLHVIEHIGLGRYGDALNPQGSRLAAGELARVLRPGGRLFLSVPVGRQRVCFNAHRVFAPTTIVSLFASLELRTFALVNDSGRFSEGVAFDGVGDLDYGCGMFEFVRPAPEQ
jgi:SAM-dependent methyltransferase